ncbi:MAG TPA: mechanosensitive ion channel domain-containing protein [Candidatus Saccharimonadales bacterium]|nr:mechanosensitive ion channel domain-containing protein [Candidatus Saccharimonadales bacterium]
MDIDGFLKGFVDFFAHPDANFSTLRFAGIVLVSLLVIYLANKLFDAITPKISETVTKRAENDTDYVRYRRVETFLSVGTTVLRVGLVLGVVYTALQITDPQAAPFAVVGAGTIFVVLAGATLVPLLRDITTGFIMIAERWFNVGDHIVVEPFAKLGGVVEKVTLRSTRLRSVNGEIIWLHNQYMQGVRVTTAASHTLAVEIFVNDKARGKKIIEDAAKVIPSNPITIPQALAISETMQIDKNLWRITAICEVTPYREWLIERFGVDVIKKNDELSGAKPCIVHGPLVIYADTTAEKRFRRAVRARSVTTDVSDEAKAESVPVPAK